MTNPTLAACCECCHGNAWTGRGAAQTPHEKFTTRAQHRKEPRGVDVARLAVRQGTLEQEDDPQQAAKALPPRALELRDARGPQHLLLSCLRRGRQRHQPPELRTDRTALHGIMGSMWASFGQVLRLVKENLAPSVP